MPTESQILYRPDVKNISVEGWAVSNDRNAKIQFFIDGYSVNTNISRISRNDADIAVSPQFGGVVNTPNAGFKGNVDVSSLDKGRHEIKVLQISRYGDIICEMSRYINIENKKYIGEMCIDYPTYNQAYQYGNVMRITGWAVSNDENAVIQIYIDGALKINAGRHYRGDVIGFMNKYENKTQNAGFVSEISTEGLSQGTHTLTVKQKSRFGDDIITKDTIFIIEKKNNDDDNTNNILTAGSKGIDVSQHQGDIDWSKVANSGIKFAMIRIGYRGYGSSGGQAEDKNFKNNFKNAKANGLRTGIYYYSTALNTTEAQKDAEYVLSLLRKYGYQNQVTMPVAIDLEVNSPTVRDANVDKGTRTAIANTFCSIMKNNGYTPMIYASKAFLNDNMNASQLNYDIWVAQYNSKCTYKGNYSMWQYSSSGKVSGINGNVDCNVCYKNY